ncbi:MAG TPA: hypothetical protein VH914_22410 [Acidimicrobiia bacterium]|jgi:uncharacterized protein (TIGR02246 family)|nr:hypothetical protein [Acidimicrobiia bacterium]
MATDHPNLDLDGAAAHDARAAVDRLIAELQAGWDSHDADVTNRHFAGDIVWGSPFGATVRGYDQLHAIHIRLKQKGRGGRASRFELVEMVTPADGVAVAQIRRVALDDDGFSEMALYVLARRDDTWWVAAGQNTPVREAPTD